MSTTETDAVIAAEAETPWDFSDFCTYHSALRGFCHWGEQNIYASWYLGMSNEFVLHPSVKYMVEKHRPVDFKQLALEWAHVSTKDDTRVAYTRTAGDGQDGRRTLTSIGKYLSRHWPYVADHIRRDAAALYTPDDRRIVSTIPDFVTTVEIGPRSCMASTYGAIEFRRDPDYTKLLAWLDNKMCPQPRWDLHPYSCYRPELGWSMAQRWAKIDGKPRLDGRALVYKDLTISPKPVFVRTYKRNMSDPTNGWSETDFALQSWLEQNGCVKVDEWPEGTKIAAPIIPGSRELRRIPYIDGSRKLLKVDPETGIGVIVHARSDTPDHYWGELTGGRVERNVPQGPSNNWPSLEDFAYDNDHDIDDCRECERCGRPHHSDDSNWVGRQDDTVVCESCYSNYYQEVRGYSQRHGYITYFLDQNDAYYVEGANFYIDADNVPDSVCYTVHGEYMLKDDCVYINRHTDWYPAGSEDVCTDIDGSYQLRDDCVWCEDEGEYVLYQSAFESYMTPGHFFSDVGDRDDYDKALREERAETEETEVKES